MTEAATALLAVLEAENVALEAMDLAGAAALVERKQRAADRFVEAAGQVPAELRAKLHDAAARNRVLLERGLDVQGRVLAIVASAARPARVGYGARGTAGNVGRCAVALSVRA